jgi:Type II secretion system (T2SS), protein E, N-terminal domain
MPSLDIPPLPTLDLDFDNAAAFIWPQPPFARRQSMASLREGVVPCRIETPNGVTVEGEMVTFDARVKCLRFRVGAGRDALSLPFTRVHRLTLTTPWALARRAPHAPIERVPSAAQERDYRIELADGAGLTGRTMGHVSNDTGLFLFAPSADGSAVLRVFVPKEICGAVSYGASAEELASERWVATPEALIAAIEAQRHSRIVSVGDALIELGLVTRGVIDQMVRQQGPEREAPLGEMLIAAGYLERADLQTALAHKMGYPMVDLTRFPIEAQAARKLSQRSIVEHRALPLMQHGTRLIVAVDDLASIARLKQLNAFAGVEVVPVLAPRGRLSLVLTTLTQRLGSDLWAGSELALRR